MHEKLSRQRTRSVICKLAIHRKKRFLHYVLPCKTQLSFNQKLLPAASNVVNYYEANKKEATYAI